jgi:hypothetical protein
MEHVSNHLFGFTRGRRTDRPARGDQREPASPTITREVRARTMRLRVAHALALILPLVALAPRASAQRLHTNDRWTECAIVLDPSLTRGAWKQFVDELGIVTYFRPVASAAALGRKHVEVGLLNWGTRIDDADAAWNDTFSHPDATHHLVEGATLYIPGLTARAGVTDRLDVGAYFTKAVGANYGFVGGQLQYALLNDAARHLAAAGRVSVVRLFGPEDMRASTYGLDFLVSREFSRFAPYVGVSGYMARARETTPKVDLDDVTAFGAQATMGVSARLSAVRLGAEFTLGKVPTTSVKLAFGR